jgi:predicted nucleotidyltransferase component of viral defense system
MLHWRTVSKELKEILILLMLEPAFNDFYLVGGTALSLQIGHRKSIDIDLFTDISYDRFDLEIIDSFIRQSFPYVTTSDIDLTFGKAYYVGYSPDTIIKLDIFHADKFIFEKVEIESVRMVNIKEIVAMKLDVIQRIGRKKDFWDIYELKDYFSFHEMLDLHKQRYPYSHDRNLIIDNFTNFEQADDESDPMCLKGNIWDVIKYELVNWVNKNI